MTLQALLPASTTSDISTGGIQRVGPRASNNGTQESQCQDLQESFADLAASPKGGLNRFGK